MDIGAVFRPQKGDEQEANDGKSCLNLLQTIARGRLYPFNTGAVDRNGGKLSPRY